LHSKHTLWAGIFGLRPTSRAGLRGVQGPGDRAHRAQRVLQPAGPAAAVIAQTAHRDGNLADAERGQHGELPRGEGRDRLEGVGRFRELQRDRVVVSSQREATR
jgi:hypothetical protein